MTRSSSVSSYWRPVTWLCPRGRGVTHEVAEAIFIGHLNTSPYRTPGPQEDADSDPDRGGEDSAMVESLLAVDQQSFPWSWKVKGMSRVGCSAGMWSKGTTVSLGYITVASTCPLTEHILRLHPLTPSPSQVVCGQNPAYDYFSCQHQIFYRQDISLAIDDVTVNEIAHPVSSLHPTIWSMGICVYLSDLPILFCRPPVQGSCSPCEHLVRPALGYPVHTLWPCSTLLFLTVYCHIRPSQS